MLSLVVFILVIASASMFSILLVPSSVQAADCGGPYPPAPERVWATSGPMSGEVTLHWDATAYANRYAVAYGMESNGYTYGADNIGGSVSTSYTVKSLVPGAKYYFRIAAAKDCSSGPFSSEVAALAMTGETVAVQPSMTSEVPAAAQKVVAPSVSAVSPSVSGGPTGKLMLSAVTGSMTGEVTVYWQNNESADNYHLVYGTSPNDMRYGALNIGKEMKYTVKSLIPGTKYYFSLVPVKGAIALYTTQSVSAVAGGGVEIVQTSPEALRQPSNDFVPMPTTTPPPELQSQMQQQGEPTPTVASQAAEQATPAASIPATGQ